MPNANAVVARVIRIAPSAAEAAASAATTVEFEGDRTAMLPPGKRATGWRGLLEHAQRFSIPAFVETDPETNVITRVLIPLRGRVVALDPTVDGGYDVRFIESHAGHHLLRSHGDFLEMLNALEAARTTGTAVFVTSTRDEHEIIDVRPAPPEATESPLLEGGGDRETSASVVSEAQAAQLFNDMAATSCDPSAVPPPCIPFLFPDDGCYARAHEMIRLMRLQGIEGEKIWIFASGNSNLKPATSNHPDCQVGWWYHVAPTLQVNTVSGVEKRVIDPSLMNGLATANAWRARQNDPTATFQFTDAQPFWPNNGGNDDTYTLTNQYLAEKRGYLQDRVTEYGPLPYTCPIIKRLEFILDRSTFGQDEATTMLQAANPAVIQSALFVTLDGFKPQELGITASTPTTPPSIKPTIALAPALTELEIRVVHLGLEDPAHLNRRQRITWNCDVRFTGTNDFVFAGDTRTVSVSASISGQSANASLLLIKQPNPYQIDGATSWLSTDLRVFQIRAGQQRFSATMGATAAQAPAFIQQVLANLKSGATGGQTFDNDLSTDQQTSRLELSESVSGTKVFNFAVARVRYIGTLQAQNVRVFFRLFPASTTSLAFDLSSTYRRATQGGVTIPLLGLQSNQLVTIPCFASARVDSATTSLTAQTDAPNVRDIAASATERKEYFGAWLDFNQTTLQFPLNAMPADGPWAANRKSIQDLVRGQHQCLVAEIAFDPTAIPGGATPGTSDKLAQRNLAIVESANPGVVGSRRIAQTFELRATAAQLPEGAEHDELMIDWGATPVGSVVKLYLPAVNGEEVVDLAARTNRSSNLALIDEHTLQLRAGGMSWIPIPKGGDTNLTGLITIDLPPSVVAGQVFTVVVRQVTGGHQRVADVAAVALKRVGRRTLGSFQITIPVRTKNVILPTEQRLLSNLRSIERSIPPTDRWFPVFRRYVTQVASRVDGLGGDSTQVAPSPSGDWQQPAATTSAIGAVCTSLALTVAALAALFIILGATSGTVRLVLGVIVAAVLLMAVSAWIRSCQPSLGRLLLTIGLGTLVGLLILLLL